MALSSFAILSIFVFVSFIGYVQSEEPELTDFGKKVKSLLSDENYEKIFSIKAESDDELREAIKNSTKKFSELLGIPFDKSAEEKLEKENENIGLDRLNTSINFHGQTYSISTVFTDLGVLTSDNLDDLAQKYVDELNKSAKSLDKDDVNSTFMAIITSDANFLKSENVTSEEDVKKIEKAFMDELKKY